VQGFRDTFIFESLCLVAASDQSSLKCAVSVTNDPIISLASIRLTSLKQVLSGDVMQAIASSSSIKSKRKFRQKRAFDAQAFLDSAGVARKVVEYRRSQKIDSQGDPATSVMYIQKGGVKVSVVNETGKEAVVAILGPGDFFGEGCLAGQSICMATATTIAPTTVLVIEKDEMIRVLHEEHEFSDRFIAYMLARNIRVEEDLIDQLFNSSEKRLARTLLLLARYGAQGQPQQVLPKVSQEMLAEMIGTTRSRVNFFMNKFRKLGFIRYNGEIHVNNSLLSVVLHE
jgi:CRP/FNR family cyclic AMP-dependent transcriptional regulator